MLHVRNRPKWFPFLRAEARRVVKTYASILRLTAAQGGNPRERIAYDPHGRICRRTQHRLFPPLGKKIKALLVWPKIPHSFWAFSGMLELLPEKVVMPPLGLITVAALCPPEWTLRLVDEAVEDLTDDDLRWADLVMVGGMEVQKDGMQEVLARARAPGPAHDCGRPLRQQRTGAHAGAGRSCGGGRARRGVCRNRRRPGRGNGEKAL